MRSALLVVLVGCNYAPPGNAQSTDDAPRADAAGDAIGLDAAADAMPDGPPAVTCEGYTPAGTSAYLVIAAGANWPTARAACAAAANGHLVVIADPTENALVRGLLPTTIRFWMGFADRDVEGTWKWLDDTDVPLAQQFWDGAQPNDNQTFGGEDCGEMSNAGTWNDKNCDNNVQPYVCECP